MEELDPHQLMHRLTVHPDVVKVIGFMRHNIEYCDLLTVARWVAEIAPLIWPNSVRKDYEPCKSGPIDYTWSRSIAPKDGQTSSESRQVAT